jgi:hypothetical protein
MQYLLIVSIICVGIIKGSESGRQQELWQEIIQEARGDNPPAVVPFVTVHAAAVAKVVTAGQACPNGCSLKQDRFLIYCDVCSKTRASQKRATENKKNK